MRRSLATAAVLGVLIQPAFALDPEAQRGQTFVKANCAMCHAVGQGGDSPLSIAPPFRTLFLRYPIEDLERPLAEGTITRHPTMPAFTLDVAEVEDVIAYLKTLETP